MLASPPLGLAVTTIRCRPPTPRRRDRGDPVSTQPSRAYWVGRSSRTTTADRIFDAMIVIALLARARTTSPRKGEVGPQGRVGVDRKLAC